MPIPPIPGRPPSHEAGRAQGKSPPSVWRDGKRDGFLLSVDSQPTIKAEQNANNTTNIIFFIIQLCFCCTWVCIFSRCSFFFLFCWSFCWCFNCCYCQLEQVANFDCFRDTNFTVDKCQCEILFRF